MELKKQIADQIDILKEMIKKDYDKEIIKKQQRILNKLLMQYTKDINEEYKK